MSQQITSTISTVVSSIENVAKDHKNYKKNLGLVAKYCIISGLIILISFFIMQIISSLYKDKILPYGIRFIRKLFLILGIFILCIGIFSAVGWNYYV
jgi:hypothetical protein